MTQVHTKRITYHKDNIDHDRWLLEIRAAGFFEIDSCSPDAGL